MPVPVPEPRQLRGRPVDDVSMGTMVLDHERLDVYQLSLDFMAFGNGVIEGLPRGRSHLADQLTRASLSIVLRAGRPGPRVADNAAWILAHGLSES